MLCLKISLWLLLIHGNYNSPSEVLIPFFRLRELFFGSVVPRFPHHADVFTCPNQTKCNYECGVWGRGLSIHSNDSISMLSEIHSRKTSNPSLWAVKMRFQLHLQIIYTQIKEMVNTGRSIFSICGTRSTQDPSRKRWTLHLSKFN